jgi:hypothetical protein
MKKVARNIWSQVKRVASSPEAQQFYNKMADTASQLVSKGMKAAQNIKMYD